MKNKPDPAQLMSYLYGELAGEEKAHFEALLAASPELAEELRETRQLLGGLHYLPDVEAPPSPVFLASNPEAPRATAHHSESWPGISLLAQALLAVAAGLSLLLVAGSLTRTQVIINRQGLSLRFGTEMPVRGSQAEEMKTLVAGLKAEIRSLKNHDTQVQAARLHQELTGLKKTLTELNQRVEEQSKRQGRQLVAGKSRRQLSETQLDQMLASLSDENVRLIEEAFQAATDQQQQQLQESLANFARYLDKIRAEDTELVLASLEELDRRAESKFKETDQAIDALLQTVQNRE
jgi:hypothetical protein